MAGAVVTEMRLTDDGYHAHRNLLDEWELCTELDCDDTKLCMEANRRGVKPPSAATLKKYGMSARDWLAIARDQGWKCPILDRLPVSGELVVDHEHVKGWTKMKPEERRQYVRGLVSRYANYRLLSKNTTRDIARRVAEYLDAYHARRGA